MCCIDLNIIKKAGLTESQAKAYLALIEHRDVTPAELAQYIGETRTNAYAIIDKLLQYGLISKKNAVNYGAKYNANHPSCLETLAENRRKALAKNEKQVKDNINSLIDYYYEHSEKPGTVTLQGLDGIKSVYNDTLKSENTVYLVRTMHDDRIIGTEFLYAYVRKRADKGIDTYGIYTKSPRSIPYLADAKKLKIVPSFMPPNAYTAPVEINIYDDKVAFISYGDTQMATIIQSPPVAEAMKQLLGLLAKNLPKS